MAPLDSRLRPRIQKKKKKIVFCFDLFNFNVQDAQSRRDDSTGAQIPSDEPA